MSKQSLSQPPLFDYTYLDLFDMKINSRSSNDWDRFLEEFLIVRFLSFRQSFQNENFEFLCYFSNLLESSFIILKSDLLNNTMYNIKTILLSNDPDSIKLNKLLIEYLHIVNFGRIVIVHLISTLFKSNVSINNEIVQKFMKSDSELDNNEKIKIRNKIMSYKYIKSHLPVGNEEIGRLI